MYTLYKGLPTKDETSETTVQNLHCLLSKILCKYKLVYRVAMSINMPSRDNIQSRRLNLTCNRHI